MKKFQQFTAVAIENPEERGVLRDIDHTDVSVLHRDPPACGEERWQAVPCISITPKDSLAEPPVK